MKELILIRHAKSDRDQPVPDRDRPLTSRGVRDAGLVAAKVAPYLAAVGALYSSPARRAYTTALLFAARADLQAEAIRKEEAFYTFSSRDLRRAIAQLPDELSSVAIFGHNEAITDFVNAFAAAGVPNVPTSGFIRMQFLSGSWKALERGVTLQTVFAKDLRP
jgi:phosphohistidine phosphatase